MIVNLLGAVMMIAGLLPAFLVGWVVDEIWPASNAGVPVGGLIFFLVSVGSDLVFRWKNFRERGRLRFVHPLTGGMFFFVPIWVCFGLLPLVALPIFLIFNPPKKIPPPRVAYHLESSWNIVYLVKPA